jgi:hypothetical protein
MRLALVFMGVVFAASCATLPPRSSPLDMSAAEHEREAARQEQLAARELAQYAPKARSVDYADATSGSFSYPRTYNPTARHRDAAEAHRGYAAAHRAAARELLAREEEECATIPAGRRAECPLLDLVVDVDPVEDGVRLRLADNAEGAGALRLLRCHLAHAATRGFEGMDACPLFLPGVEAVQRSDPHCVDLVAEDPRRRQELERRSERLVAPVHDEAHRRRR